jgi:hypothetical protein
VIKTVSDKERQVFLRAVDDAAEIIYVLEKSGISEEQFLMSIPLVCGIVLAFQSDEFIQKFHSVIDEAVKVIRRKTSKEVIE